MTTERSLRERKKQATRMALSHAAWSLMVEHGLEAVSPEMVSDAAGVSPRTFRNYFSSREEAIVDGIIQRGSIIGEGLRARPRKEPVWDSLFEVLPDALVEIVGDRDDVIVLMRLCQESPALLAQQVAVFERMDQLLVEDIAARTGTDPERDLGPSLLASMVGVACQNSVRMWVQRPDTDLHDLVRESLAQLRTGLPLGATATPA